ncbi:SNUT3/LISCH7 family protein [Aspergillus aculeatinus CBS 121060]|uniref:DUF1777-domain-containing protein n=2 Tax=Aspergillus subgen. Circumdati TaxID=2720871 RepID=A0ACD1HB90_9EURO|nr:DUF1777-domain-containing protein [Aspergillus brunneoviolaceus CBS 621.78]XP_025504694.1 DUF1777-domain-containing protein [Aspergillus aculeatinus CBS 121060]RAH41139.1 DUF1777-domain-containing protein [Aspergillus brunneoviolaceus CBS 621.78]RAH70871.1 DUF1777-domain-containing protein [Aspergillus aculeatinus CBS 121060]
MAEPPAKRARRPDSSTMWDQDDRRTRSPEPELDYTRSPRREHGKEQGRRDGPRDDRRYRSRSRDRRDRRRDRSRSGDRRDRDRRDRDRDGRGTRERSISRERYHGKRGYPSKGDRYRSRSPVRNGNRDKSRTPPPRGPRADRNPDRRDPRAQANGVADTKSRHGRPRDETEMDIDDAADDDDFEEMMRRNMGFTRFRSTKNTKVPGNNVYGVRKEKKTEYRQYMNRIGGFNRPLSPSRQ